MITFEEGQDTFLNLIVGNRKVRCCFTKEGPKLWVAFPYNKDLLGEIKIMDGAKWWGYEDPPIKKWSIRDNQRNKFQLAYLAGMNPYAPFEKPLIDVNFNRPLYNHQQFLVKFGLTRHYCIFAAEMGTGKSLAAIEIMEHSGVGPWWWIAPKSALAATQLELKKWKCKIQPELLTYDGLKRILENWTEGEPPPVGVIFDESSRCKTPSAQRTQAAMHLANSIRDYYGDNGYVILMSGSPAPKSPADWWAQCEIACPGFIKEGTQPKFIYRLAIIEKNDSPGGGYYNKVIAWKDSEKRCEKCGKFITDADHNLMEMVNNPHVHTFVPCTNEVAYLYERMKGLVEVVFKKDCLDLPAKQYRLIKVKPSIQTVNAARMITQGSPGAAQKLVHLRELSDGFQYREEIEGKETCDACGGKKFIDDQPCVTCSGTGEKVKVRRDWTKLPTPKEELLIDLLDEHEEVGRFVVYAAFTASIDRIVEICEKQKWEVIRVDGRGWWWSGQFKKTDTEMLEAFQMDKDNFPRVVFVGHPGSAGMGLTLTASPSIFYWSNDFNAESRIQSEDRIHRAGMDVNRGATIIDVVHLPTDKLILDNLKIKRDLQSITLGDLQEALNNVDVEGPRKT